MSHDASDLETEALSDLRHRFAAVHELSTRVEIELLDRNLEDSSKDFVILWHLANHEERTRFGAHEQRCRYVGVAAVSLLDANLSSIIDYRELKGQFILSQVGAVKIQAPQLSVRVSLAGRHLEGLEIGSIASQAA